MHPHIRTDHPASPVEVVFTDGTSTSADYSGAWEETEAEWERMLETRTWYAEVRPA